MQCMPLWIKASAKLISSHRTLLNHNSGINLIIPQMEFCEWEKVPVAGRILWQHHQGHEFGSTECMND